MLPAQRRRLDQTGITRGATLKGEPKALADLPDVPMNPAPARAEPLWQRQIGITPDAGQIYTECADIYNPIHTERRVAKAAGLPDVILHGSATQAIACSAIVDGCLGGAVEQVRRFVGPCVQWSCWAVRSRSDALPTTR